MNTLKEIIDDSYENNVIPIRTQTDLGQPVEDWLSKLDEGTVFLTQHITTKYREKYVLNEFTVIAKSNTGAISLQEYGEIIWVIPSRFCQTYSLFGVL